MTVFHWLSQSWQNVQDSNDGVPPRHQTHVLRSVSRSKNNTKQGTGLIKTAFWCLLLYQCSENDPRNYTQGNCSGDWIQVGDRCYLIGIESRHRMPWDSAKTNCMNSGGSLLIVDSPDDFKPVLDYLMNQQPTLQSLLLWIGLRQPENLEGAFQWIDGSNLTNASYTNWQTGEPGTQQGRCVVICKCNLKLKSMLLGSLELLFESHLSIIVLPTLPE